MLQSIFGALASGASQSQSGSQQQAGGDVLSSVLGSLMGGGQTTQQASQSSPSAGSGVEGLLGSLLGGGQTTQQASQPSQSAGSGMEGLLGSLMGGGQTAASAQTTTNQYGTNPLLNLVGSGSNPMVNTLIQPIASQIASRLGIPQALAMSAVTFAIHYMITQHGTKLANGQDVSDVLEKHSDPNHLNTTGVTQSFAKQAGVDQKTAANTLSEVFKLLGAPVPKQ